MILGRHDPIWVAGSSGVQFPAEACCKHTLSPNLLSAWKSTVLQRAHTLFREDEQREEDPARIAELEQLLGRATRQIEILGKRKEILSTVTALEG
jgi:transposase-like protein